MSAPVHKLRIGAVQASIWQNEGQSGAFYNVQFSRSYKDGEEWKHTEHFNHDDLMNVAKLAERAEAWIAGQKQKPGDSPDQPSTA